MIVRPDVIPYLKHVLQHEYDQGDSVTRDAIEDAIVELERISDIAQALHRENQHLRKVNQRMVETLVEIAPLKKYIICNDTEETKT